MKRTLCLVLTLMMVMTITALVSAEPAITTPTTIRFMDTSPSPEREAMYRQFIEDFKPVEPNITVEYENVPYDESHSKLVTYAATQSLPDIYQIHATWTSEFAMAGWALKLDDYVENYALKDHFTPFTMNVLFKIRQQEALGGIYSIPDGLLDAGVIYRKDWFAEAGITPDMDWTWDDFFEICEKLTDPAQDRYGLAYRGGRAGFDRIIEYVMSVTKGHFYEPDGTSVLFRPEVLDAFVRYTDVYKKGQAPKDSISWGFAEMVQGFSNGTCGMLVQNPDASAVVEGGMVMDLADVGVLPMPRNQEDGKLYVDAGSAYMYTIASNTEYADAAWAFVGFLSSPENNMIYCKSAAMIPIMKVDTDSDPYFSTGLMGDFVKTLDRRDMVMTASQGYFPELGGFREPLMDAETQKYLQDMQSAEDTLKILGDYLTKYQQQYMIDFPDVPLPSPIEVGSLG